MPSNAIAPTQAVDYFGFAKQSAKGTSVAPAYFAAFMDEVTLDHNQAIRQIREAGGGVNVGRDVKDAYLPGVRFSFAARPDIAGAAYAMFLGADSITGAGDPYSHVLTQTEATVWVSFERDINDEVIERIADGVISEVQLDLRRRDAGPEAIMICTGIGLEPEYQGSAASDSYESDRPYLRSDGAWKIDGNVETNVESATCTMRWIYDESIYLDAVTRGDLIKLRFEADIEVVQLFNSAAEVTAYRGTHYGAGGGSAVSETVWQPSATDSFEIALANVQTQARSLTINIPKVAWGEAKLTEPSPEGSEAVKLTRTGHLISATEPVTVTVENANAAAYI